MWSIPACRPPFLFPLLFAQFAPLGPEHSLLALPSCRASGEITPVPAVSIYVVVMRVAVLVVGVTAMASGVVVVVVLFLFLLGITHNLNSTPVSHWLAPKLFAMRGTHAARRQRKWPPHHLFLSVCAASVCACVCVRVCACMSACVSRSTTLCPNWNFNSINYALMHFKV